MLCLHCEETITAAEFIKGMVVGVNTGSDLMHRECLLRGVVGSVTHIRGECKQQGGSKDCHECEVGLTKREAAIASWREFQKKQRLDLCNPN
jgi:hypothetical protein